MYIPPCVGGGSMDDIGVACHRFVDHRCISEQIIVSNGFEMGGGAHIAVVYLLLPAEATAFSFPINRIIVGVTIFNVNVNVNVNILVVLSL